MTQSNPAEWPVDGLEPVPVCPLCNSPANQVLHSGISDRVFRVAAGKWTLKRCLHCESAYLDPRPTQQTIGAAYASYYTHQADDHPIVRHIGGLRTRLHDAINGYRNARYGLAHQPSNAWGKWLIPLLPPLRSAVDTECRHLPRLPVGGGSLLDVGCGNGRFLCLASEMGWQVQGIDTDPKAVDSARARGLQVQCGGIELLRDCNEQFDVITLSHVIEHVHDPVELVRQLHRMLKSGGLLWLETPNLKSLGHRLYGANWRGLEPPRHLILFNPCSLKNILHAAGFIDVQQRWRGLAVFFIFATSEAIRSDADAMRASRGGKPKIRDILAELFEMVVPSSREFITLVAVKKA